MVRKSKQKVFTNKSSSAACCCIIKDFLYLGPVSAASNSSYLSSSGITHVLSIGKSASPEVEGVVYHRLALLDDEDADISAVVEKACQFINEVKTKGGRVLVHCSAAISRSPTVIAAYLMKMEGGVNLRTALEMLVNGRESVAPNVGFLRQLGEIEMELFGVEKSSVDFDAVEGKIRLKEILKRDN